MGPSPSRMTAVKNTKKSHTGWFMRKKKCKGKAVAGAGKWRVNVDLHGHNQSGVDQEKPTEKHYP
jgi:hypothetical protein